MLIDQELAVRWYGKIHKISWFFTFLAIFGRKLFFKDVRCAWLFRQFMVYWWFHIVSYNPWPYFDLVITCYGFVIISPFVAFYAPPTKGLMIRLWGQLLKNCSTVPFLRLKGSFIPNFIKFGQAIWSEPFSEDVSVAKWLHAGKVRGALCHQSLVPSLTTVWDTFSGIGLGLFITTN